jgi:integrase/recombinase XerD
MSILPNNNHIDEWLIAVKSNVRNLHDNYLINKDIWSITNDLKLKNNQHSIISSISFELIQQDWLRLLVKLYVLVRSSRKISAGTIYSDIVILNRFSKFIYQQSVSTPAHINNHLFEDYNCYLLDSLNLAPNTIRASNQCLANFFNICREEDWLKIDTYWFRGRCKISSPQNESIEYIPEEVWQKLNEHLHHLTEPMQRMIIVIRSTGLRIGELLNLPLDCLRQKGGQWRLRFLTEKYQVVDELPICNELVVVIKEQQEYIRQQFNDEYSNLFGSSNRFNKALPRIMRITTFNNRINRLAREYNICDNQGKVWHFKSHQFRKTLATTMTNAGVRDLIIQKYLRHRNSDMQNYYKHLSKEVLGEEYEELMKDTNYVNSMGELVAAHKPQSLVTEIIRRKMYQITTQYGECHRPVLKTPCQTVNSCWRCESWLTSTEDLPALERDAHRVKAELDVAAELGMIRQQQGLTVDLEKLEIRIKGLKKVNDKD